MGATPLHLARRPWWHRVVKRFFDADARLSFVSLPFHLGPLCFAPSMPDFWLVSPPCWPHSMLCDSLTGHCLLCSVSWPAPCSPHRAPCCDLYLVLLAKCNPFCRCHPIAQCLDISRLGVLIECIGASACVCLGCVSPSILPLLGFGHAVHT